MPSSLCFSFIIFHLGKRRGNEEAETKVPEKVAKGESKTRKDEKTPLDVYNEFQPLSFFLTKVHGIPSEFNASGAMSLKGEKWNGLVCSVS